MNPRLILLAAVAASMTASACNTVPKDAPQAAYALESAYASALSAEAIYVQSGHADPAVRAQLQKLDSVAYPLVMAAEAAARSHAADADSQAIAALIAVQNLATAVPK